MIAIENARLLDEVQARTRDLEELLAQQTATADVLKVLSRSTFDLGYALETLMQTAARLCDAESGGLTVRDGDVFRYAAFAGDLPGDYRASLSARPIVPGRDTLAGRVLLEGQPVQVADLAADPDYALPDSINVARIRTCLIVPLLRDGTVVGTLGVNRTRVAPFTERQIDLLRTFADQAVIAIQNTRLFEAEQGRARELGEALQQQTATAEVLKVIAGSAFDLQPVFDTLVSSAVDLCDAHSGLICIRDGEVFRYRGSAGSGQTEALMRYLEDHPATPGRGTIAGRVILSGQIEAIPDRLEDPDFAVPLSSLGDEARALLGVPLLRNDAVEGVLIVSRLEPGLFASRQIEVLQTFADQAVIAIQNARLFEEVQAKTRELEQSLAQQTATADVLKVISRSALDLEPALITVCETAARLCQADQAAIYRRDGELFRFAASVGFPAEYEQAWREAGAQPIDPTSPLVGHRALAERRPVQVLDVTADPAYFETISRVARRAPRLGSPCCGKAS